MHRILILGLILFLLAGPASAQDVGRIGVYADDMATGCLVQDTPGLVQAYIVQTGATEANTSQFALAIDPSVQLSFLTGALAPGLISLGDLFDGITITYVGCKTSFPLTLMTLSFWGQGTSTTCGALRIVPDPSLASGQVEVVDCSGSVHFAATSNAWVNDAGDCECIYAARVCVETSAPGLNVSVDGNPYAAPRCFYWDSGTNHQVSTTSPQGLPDLKYEFAGWSDGGAMTHTIDIGDEDTTVTAIFELAPRTRLESVPSGLTVAINGYLHITPYDAYWVEGSSHVIRAFTPQGPPDSLLTFLAWSDGKAISHTVVATDRDTTFTAYFGYPPTFEVDTAPTGLDIVVDGVPRAAPYAALWPPGTVHSIEAVSPQGDDSVYVFTAWSDGGAISHNVVAGLEDSTFVASFTLAPEVFFETVPAGLDVEVDGTVYATPYSEHWAPSASHQIGAVSPQNLDSVYVFSSWSDGGAQSHIVSIGPNDTTFTAAYVLAPRATLETDPPGLDVVVDSVVYTTPYVVFWQPGSSHEIGAVSPQGVDSVYVFSSWSDGGAQSHIVSIGPNDTTFTAAYVLGLHGTVDTNPTGLDVMVDSVVYPAPHDVFWLLGSSHEIGVASPQGTDPVYVFDSWGDAGAITHTVSAVNDDTTFVATFTRLTRVTLNTVPQGVEVTADSVVYVSPSNAFWFPGSAHTVSVPDSIESGYIWSHFLNWSDGGAREHVFVTPDADTVLTAYFVALTGIGDSPVPNDVVLRPNMPNPFNPTTHIEFSVPTPQFVELLIFDVSGRLVRRLYADEAPVGYTTVTWNGRSDRGEPAGSGVYFYQVRTSEKRVTRKMVLLK